jgi:hypothetical protein
MRCGPSKTMREAADMSDWFIYDSILVALGIIAWILGAFWEG